MKKLILLFTVITASLIANATTTFYFKGEKGTNNMSSTSGWTLDADGTTPASLSPYDYWKADKEEDVNLVFGKNTTYGSCQITTANKYFEIANITFASDLVGKNGSFSLWNYTVPNALKVTNDITLEDNGVGYTTYISYAQNVFAANNLSVSVGGNINVGNGVTLKIGTGTAAWTGHMITALTVGNENSATSGNINVTATTKNTNLYIGTIAENANASAPSTQILGKINLTSSDTATATAIIFAGNPSASYYATYLPYDWCKINYTSIGGLSGNGNFYASNMNTYLDENAYKLSINLEINAKNTDSTFTGNFSSLNATSSTKRAEDVTFNITKTGAKKQTIIASSASVSTVKIEEGELALSNGTGTFGDISLNNGILSVAGASTETNIGELCADSITWNGGTINIDINEYTADLITVNDFSKGEADTFNFIFTEGEDGIVIDTDYLIVNAEGGSFGFDASDFSAEIDGYLANFTVDGGQVFVSFTAVPEPATIAGIFGVLALAFAAYRRRK